MLLSISGVRILIRFCQDAAISVSRFESTSWCPQHPRQRAHRDVPRDRPEREDALGLTVAGDEGSGTLHRDAVHAADRAGEDLQQHAGLAVAGETRQADDLAAMGDQFLTVGLLRRFRADHDGANGCAPGFR